MGLTDIQKDIVALIIEGKNNTEIAEKLHYSKGKIQKELEKIYKFFKIKSSDSTAKRIILVREVTKLELTNLMM